jgi:hypothetical protein
VTLGRPRRALAWVGGALSLWMAPRCAPQDIYFYDPETRTLGGEPDAGAPAPDPDPPARPEPAAPDEPDATPGPYVPVQPACASAACEACVETSACAGTALELCHPESGACVAGCDPSAGDAPGNCPAATRCDPTRSICLECVTADDCAAPTPACDDASGRCVGCVSPSDCTPQAPVCDTSALECVECLADGDCAATFDVCRESERRCVECETDADCVARRQPGDDDDDERLCSPALRCVECLIDADCLDDPDKPFCSSELECEDERE